MGLQAVNAGSIVRRRPNVAAKPPTTGPTIRVSIAQRQTLNSGGILPLVLGIPALLIVLSLAIRERRRG